MSLTLARDFFPELIHLLSNKVPWLLEAAFPARLQSQCPVLTYQLASPGIAIKWPTLLPTELLGTIIGLYGWVTLMRAAPSRSRHFWAGSCLAFGCMNAAAIVCHSFATRGSFAHHTAVALDASFTGAACFLALLATIYHAPAAAQAPPAGTKHGGRNSGAGASMSTPGDASLSAGTTPARAARAAAKAAVISLAQCHEGRLVYNDFYVGDGDEKEVFSGRVHCAPDAWPYIYHITYEDGDQQRYNAQQFEDILVWEAAYRAAHDLPAAEPCVPVAPYLQNHLPQSPNQATTQALITATPPPQPPSNYLLYSYTIIYYFVLLGFLGKCFEVPFLMELVYLGTLAATVPFVLWYFLLLWRHGMSPGTSSVRPKSPTTPGPRATRGTATGPLTGPPLPPAASRWMALSLAGALLAAAGVPLDRHLCNAFGPYISHGHLLFLGCDLIYLGLVGLQVALAAPAALSAASKYDFAASHDDGSQRQAKTPRRRSMSLVNGEALSGSSTPRSSGGSRSSLRMRAKAA